MKYYTTYLTMVLSTVHNSLLEVKIHEGKMFLFSSLMYPKGLKSCLNF